MSDAVLIQRRERILLQDALVDICREDLVHVIARKAESGLRQIVGAEREELRFLRNLVRHQRRARQLDHRTNQVVDFRSLFFEYVVGHPPHNRCLVRHFFHRGNQGNHDLGEHLHALLCDIDGGFKNSACLHLRDLRIRDAEPTSAMSEHGIELVQLLYPGQQRGQEHLQITDTLRAIGGISRHQRFLLLRVCVPERRNFHHQILATRQKFMQRWIERADRNRQTVHRLEDAGKILTLQRQQFL